MIKDILVGMPIPEATLSFCDNGGLQTIDARAAFSADLTVAIGVPGAFTPICTEQHLPGFINNAGKLKKCGFGRLLCIASNDPFVLSEWSSRLDPENHIQFLSDGNLEFARALQLTTKVPEMFLGERSERFMLITRKGVIQRYKVEPHSMSLTCSRPEDAMEDASDFFDI